jgi:hypothetical protein
MKHPINTRDLIQCTVDTVDTEKQASWKRNQGPGRVRFDKRAKLDTGNKQQHGPALYKVNVIIASDSWRMFTSAPRLGGLWSRGPRFEPWLAGRSSTQFYGRSVIGYLFTFTLSLTHCELTREPEIVQDQSQTVWRDEDQWEGRVRGTWCHVLFCVCVCVCVRVCVCVVQCIVRILTGLTSTCCNSPHYWVTTYKYMCFSCFTTFHTLELRGDVKS